MSYRIGFDGVVSAELNHVLRAVESGLNEHGVGMLTHVRAEEEAAASTASGVTPCTKQTLHCSDGSLPTEPPNVVIRREVLHEVILVTAIVVTVSLLIGLAVGYRLGKLAVTKSNST